MFSRSSVLRPALAGVVAWWAATSLLTAATLDPNFLDTPTKRWREGPVRYLLTKAEDKLFKRMKQKEERQALIFHFWNLRDPTPGTPENEFKEQFRRRVIDADHLFQETTIPGWRTDMGKVYILLGPPDSTVRDMVGQTHRGWAVWTYRSLANSTQGPNVVIAFAKNPRGEFMLSATPTLDSELAGQLRLLTPSKSTGMSQADIIRRYGRDPLLLNAGAPLGQSEMEIMMNMAEIQRLPPPEKILHELVTTEAYFDAIPLQTRMNFYQAQDGSTFTTITVAVQSAAVFYREKDGKDQPDIRVFARLLGGLEQEVVYELISEKTFLPSILNERVSIDSHLIFQAARELAPGRYILAIGLEDRVGNRVGTYRDWLEVPDLSSGGLRLSSIALAEWMQKMDNPPPPGPWAPYFLGTFRVIPKPVPEYQRSESLQVYYQIYGVEPDPSTGEPDLEITYTFQILKGKDFEFYGRQTIPHSSSEAQGYSIPLEQWPIGDYRLEVGVKNHATGESTIRQVEFRIP
ncbi:MAG: GWxTD domain-containing protein [Acidobacteriota bacterium]